MEKIVGNVYRKTSLIKVVEILKNGNVIVCNKNNIFDVWEIPKDVFESTYILLEDN